MKFLLLLLAVLSATAACSPAPDLSSLEGSGGVIIVKRVSGDLPLDADDTVWQKATSKEVSIYPQRAVRPSTTGAGAATVTLQVLYNREVLALRLEWEDEAPETQREIGQFADGAAVQWPVRYGPGVSLPYVGMGHIDHPVELWFWRADGTAETLAAEGFGTLTAQPSDGMEASGVWKDGTWRVVFKRPLLSSGEESVDLSPGKQGLVPFALATWNGEAGQRDGRKHLSSWQVLYFEKGQADSDYVKQLAWTSSSVHDLALAYKGDPKVGKRLIMEKGCAGCHAFPGNPSQPIFGPNLSYVGDVHRPGYLLESLEEPSKVIVPGKRFFAMQGEQRVSLMPPFKGSEQEKYDIVAFLRTLH